MSLRSLLSTKSDFLAALYLGQEVRERYADLFDEGDHKAYELIMLEAQNQAINISISSIRRILNVDKGENISHLKMNEFIYWFTNKRYSSFVKFTKEHWVYIQDKIRLSDEELEAIINKQKSNIHINKTENKQEIFINNKKITITVEDKYVAQILENILPFIGQVISQELTQPNNQTNRSKITKK